MNTLTRFLRELAGDPARLDRFLTTPGPVMQAAGLSGAEQTFITGLLRRLAGRDAAAIRAAIRAALPDEPRPLLNERLAGLEQVFRAPPFTPDLVAAVRLIAPQYDFAPDEASRAAWQADQNGTCWGEYEALAPLLRARPRPARVLEIGPGLGRSLVFFHKKLGWHDSELHAYEGDGSRTWYTLMGPRAQHSFCGNIELLRHTLAFNGLHDVTVFDAHRTALAELPGPYDLIYSFYAVGFHWSLEHFLADIVPLLHARSLAIFTVPPAFAPFPQLAALPHRILDCRTAWPSDGTLRLLVIGDAAA